jgi:putative transposase
LLERDRNYTGARPETRRWRISETPFTPIGSMFATVRHRTGKTKGCLSRKTGLAMALRLMMSAQAKWRKRNGANRLPEIVQGIAFKDGIKQLQTAA